MRKSTIFKILILSLINIFMIIMIIIPKSTGEGDTADVWDEIEYESRREYTVIRRTNTRVIIDTIKEVKTVIHRNGDETKKSENITIRVECDLIKCVKKLYDEESEKWIILEEDDNKEEGILIKK